MKPLRLALLPLLVVLICLAGCKKGPARASVSGEVKYRGKPLPSGTVTFVGQAVESGNIQNGRYTIERATVGPVKVAVSTPVPASALQTKQKVPGKTMEASTAEVVTVPAKYSDPEKSGLTYTVTPEGNQTYNIDIK